jgi:hypothetical protein
MSKVIMRIKPGGATEIEVQGVPGRDCKAVSRPYIERLAGEIASDEDTHEMQLPAQAGQTLRLEDGSG